MELQSTVDISTHDVLEFILRHRKASGCFRDWPRIAVEVSLLAAAQARALYITRECGAITGMIIAYIVDDNSFQVDQLLCTTKQAFKDFRAMGQKLFGQKRCVYRRGDKVKILNHY
jgi:hypothetical protein